MSISDEYGYRPWMLLPESEARARLDGILGHKVLRFNPYGPSDEALLGCIERGRWLPFPALTQMVVFHFGRVECLTVPVPHEAISLCVGNDPVVKYLSVRRLVDSMSYRATRRPVHCQVNDRNITNMGMVKSLEGKSYFVSHALMCADSNGKLRMAYRMYRLRGTEAQRAGMVRERMCESKIKMLREVLEHPHCVDYLCCRRHLFDYRTSVCAAIEAISHFPERSQF